MKIIYGLALLSAAILLIVFIGKLNRQPAAPKWASSGFVLNPVIFFTVAGIAFGTALLIDGMSSIRNAGFGMLETTLLGVIVAVTVLSAIRIRAIGRSAPKRQKWAAVPTIKPDQPVPSV
jgi:hypothetical protein